MKVIPWEDNLSSEQQSLLVGSLLGDARLESRSSAGTARLRIHHSDRQKNYLFWKYDLLKPFVNREPWKTTWIDKRNQQPYHSWFFHTKTSSVFTHWWHLFYVNGTKIVPESLEHYLDQLALAVWFMDDGCFQPESLILNTQSFSLQENKFLQDLFLQKFEACPGIQHDRRNVRLYFGKKATTKIRSIIDPYLLASFHKVVPVTTEPVKG